VTFTALGGWIEEVDRGRRGAKQVVVETEKLKNRLAHNNGEKIKIKNWKTRKHRGKLRKMEVERGGGGKMRARLTVCLSLLCLIFVFFFRYMKTELQHKWKRTKTRAGNPKFKLRTKVRG
jgi:hypothetical protein